MVLFGTDVMRQSGLSVGTGENIGKLKPPDEAKLEEIKHIIKRMYRENGNVWKDKKICDAILRRNQK